MSEQIQILYVDDEPDLLFIGKKFLEKMGDFRVTTTSKATEAMNLLAKHTYDLILSDYQMPGMDGIVFLKQLRSIGNTTPFILFTGRGREEVVIEALNNGADFYLQKGGDMQAQFAELSNTIRHTVQKRRTEHELLESQKLISEIIDFLPDATFAINNKKVVIAWNRAMEEMTGISKDEMLGKGDYAYTLPFYGERRRQLLDLLDVNDAELTSKYQSVERRGHTLSAEVFAPALYGSQGAYLWATGTPLFDVHGNRVGAIESIRDISDKKEIEDSIREKNKELEAANSALSLSKDAVIEREARLRHLSDNLPNGMVYQLTILPDGTRRFTYVSKGVKNLHGLTQEQVLQDASLLYDQIVEEDKIRLMKDEEKACQDLTTFYAEMRNILPDGSVRWVLLRSIPRKLPGGGVIWDGIETDVTTLKEMNEALIQAQRMARIGHWIYSPQLNLISWSDELFRVYGHEPHSFDVNLEKIQSLMHPDDISEYDRVLRKAVETGIYEPQEYRIIYPDESVHYIRADSAVERDEQGIVIRLIGVCQDITEQKRIEFELRTKNEELGAAYEEITSSEEELRTHYEQLFKQESELKGIKEKFEALYLHLMEGAALYDLILNDQGKPVDYRFIEINPAFEEILGLSREIVIGKTSREIYGVSDPPYLAIYARVALTGEPESFESFFEPLKKYFSISAYCPKKGSFAITFEDITVRKEAETLLKESNAYLESLIDSANFPIIIWDPELLITRFNRASELLTGRSADEVIGKTLDILFPPDQVDRTMRLIRTTLDGVRWETVELDIQHLDGSIRTVLWNSSTLYSEDVFRPIATIAQGQDITTWKKLKSENSAALEQIKQNLIHLAILNDGIRNPLTAISLIINNIPDHRISELILDQVREINMMVHQLDERWVESEQVLKFLRKHYQLSFPDRAIRDQGDLDRDALNEPEGNIKPLVEEIQAGLYTILDSIDAMVYVADMTTYNLLFVNHEGRRLFGDVTGKKCFESLQNDQSGPCEFCTNSRLLDHYGSTGVYQWEFLNTRNGRWYDCRDRAIRWIDGRFVRVEIATDITDRKNDQEALKRSEERIRAILTAIPDPIFILNKQGVFLSCHFKDISQLLAPPEIFLGKPLQNIVPGPVAEKGMQAITAVLKTDEIQSFEYDLEMADGRRWYDMRIAKLSSEEVLAIFRDITRRKQDEETIRKNEELLKSAEHIAHMGSWEMDLRTKEIIWSDELFRIMGYEPRSFTPEKGFVDRIFHPDDYQSLMATLQRSIKEKTPYKAVFRIVRPDGQIRVLEDQGEVRYDEGGIPVRMTGISIDVTERIEAEEALHHKGRSLSILNTVIISANKADDLIQLTNSILTDILDLLDFDFGGIYLVDRNRGIAEIFDSKNMPEQLLAEIRTIPIDIPPYDSLFFHHKPIIAENYSQLSPDRSLRYGVQSMASFPLFARGEVIGALNIASLTRQLLSEQEKLVLDSICSELGSTIERKAVKEEIKKTVLNLETLFNSINEMILISDLQGVIIVANTVAIRRLGYNAEEIIGMNILMLYPQEQKEEVRREMNSVISGIKDLCSIPMVAKDRTFIEIETVFSDGQWNNQEVVIGISRDITYRRMIEKALEDQTSFLKTLLDTLPTPIFSKNLEGKYTGCNAAFEEFFGIPRDKIIGRTVYEIWPEEMAVEHFNADIIVFSNPHKQVHESDIRTADGSVHQVRFYLASLFDDKGDVSGFVGIFIDITEQKKSETALSESNQKLRLLTGLTRHDIFNQLNVVEILVSMALASDDINLVKKNLHLAQEAAKNIEGAISFTREYEDFGSVSSGWQNLYHMIEAETNHISSKSLNIRDNIPVSIEIYADPIIRKVFATFLDNTQRHGRCAKNIVFSSLERFDSLIIRYEDDGVGIPYADKMRIFDHGFGNNTGFGLFLAKEILAITGLSIAESGEPGKGVRFDILVPRGKYRRGV